MAHLRDVVGERLMIIAPNDMARRSFRDFTSKLRMIASISSGRFIAARRFGLR
jgi:hypothetical protein